MSGRSLNEVVLRKHYIDRRRNSEATNADQLGHRYINGRYDMNHVIVITLAWFVLGVNGQDKACVCVPYYSCTSNTSVVVEGTGLLDIRQPGGDCPSYLDVCCPSTEIVEPPSSEPPPTKGCGFRNVDGVGFRITGGPQTETEYGEFPWMVVVTTEEFSGETNLKNLALTCGGSLIHPQVVLTAAHCVPDVSPKKYKIRAGDWDIQTNKELYPHQERYVSSVIIHDRYYAGASVNDIALLFLESPLDMIDNVNTLCLPRQDAVIPAGTKCFSSSWGGRNVFGKDGRYEVVLKKIDLPIVDRNTCQDQLRTTTLLGRRFELERSFVCAGGNGTIGKDICQDNGGSPLACPIPGQKDIFQQVGMFAWGISCGTTPLPIVYVNVPMFRNWIDQQLAIKNLTVY